MAPPSPRRSNRARPINTQSQQSSVSSSTSGRLERNTKSLNKPSSDKSTPSASLSSEPLEEPDDTLLGRRRKRDLEGEQDKSAKEAHPNMDNGSDDLQEEDDEAVRCICGSEDYPGRPPVEGPDADFFASIELTEDVTGFFVQCDVCKVWQHGACVGIFSAESSPDEYFCEQCRKDLHKIHAASNGYATVSSSPDSMTQPMVPLGVANPSSIHAHPLSFVSWTAPSDRLLFAGKNTPNTFLSIGLRELPLRPHPSPRMALDRLRTGFSNHRVPTRPLRRRSDGRP